MADRRGTMRAVAMILAGTGLGAAVTILALPYLRRVDPLGLSPVVLISLAGGFVLGWYIRGTTAANGDRDPNVTR